MASPWYGLFLYGRYCPIQDLARPILSRWDMEVILVDRPVLPWTENPLLFHIVKGGRPEGQVVAGLLKQPGIHNGDPGNLGQR